MLKSSRDLIIRTNQLAEAWRTIEPGRTLYGMTLEQFMAAAKPAFDVRVEISEAANRGRAAQSKRKDIDVALGDLIRNVVHAVKADPALGENSQLYATLGYVRRNDRYPGRKRTRAAAPSVAPEVAVKEEPQTS